MTKNFCSISNHFLRILTSVNFTHINCKKFQLVYFLPIMIKLLSKSIAHQDISENGVICKNRLRNNKVGHANSQWFGVSSSLTLCNNDLFYEALCLIHNVIGLSGVPKKTFRNLRANKSETTFWNIFRLSTFGTYNIVSKHVKLR